MHQHINHDNSNQAMTEVALGLSMAFFCLLILSLFSIGLPEQVKSIERNQKSQIPMHSEEQLTLASNGEKTAENNISQDNNQQYVFYFNGHFYNEQLIQLTIGNINHFNQNQPLILAVQDNLALGQIMTLRKQINHPKLSITMLNKAWQMRLEKMQ